MVFVGISFVIVVVGWLYWIRVAPNKISEWHVVPEVVVDQRKRNSIKRLVDSGPTGLVRLHEVAMQTPRTTVLAGSVEDGFITYITRSKRMSYPDYTTVYQDGDLLRIYGRSRYGHNDFGVNDRRVARWLTAIGLR